MTKDKTFVEAIELLESDYNYQDKITIYIDRLRFCNIKPKGRNPLWYPYSASTTYGAYFIRISNEVYKRSSILYIAHTLLHEAIHAIQYDTYSCFWLRWLNPFSSQFRKDRERHALGLTRVVFGF